MKFFAIEMNLGKLKAQFVNETEKEIMTVHKHVFYFYQSAFPIFILYLMFLTGIGVVMSQGMYLDAAMITVSVGSLIAAFMLLSAYANWRYDFVLFTTDKVIIVDSSLFHQKVEPINIENLTSVSGETKLGNLFGYGSLKLMLKESNRPELTATYVPNISVVAAKVSDIITDFQRRKMRVGAPLLKESIEMEEAAKVYGLQQNVKVQQMTGQDNPGNALAPAGQQSGQQPKDLKKQREEQAQQQIPPQEQQVAAQAAEEEIQKVPQLEAQVQALQQEVQELKQQPSALKADPQLGANQ